MYVFLIKNKHNFCASNLQTTISKLLTIPRQQGIWRIRSSKMMKIPLTESSSAVSFRPSLNNNHEGHHLILEVKENQ